MRENACVPMAHTLHTGYACYIQATLADLGQHLQPHRRAPGCARLRHPLDRRPRHEHQLVDCGGQCVKIIEKAGGLNGYQ